MKSGNACIELAKIYKARKGGQKAAASILKRALRMSRDNISDDAKEKAESLLEQMAQMQKPRALSPRRSRKFEVNDRA
jgi:hypothetical protein